MSNSCLKQADLESSLNIDWNSKSMGKTGLSTKVVLMLAGPTDLSNLLKNTLEKKVSRVYQTSNMHEAVVHAILAEPDFVLIEISPLNFSGLQLPEVVTKLKGLNKIPFFLPYADKRVKESFRQKIDSLLFLDHLEIPFMIDKMKTFVDITPPVKKENSMTLPQNRRRFETLPVSRKEIEILEKLGQLGIIKKK